ncbi:MAG TPA: bifunctional YncE family protein/alkaline phosphatase family protein, partial [Opitutaceae bacterium]|nr:bifunctional YncE family protein/alkaline phosphatase family protein [Opitutaceae bacterium]
MKTPRALVTFTFVAFVLAHGARAASREPGPVRNVTDPGVVVTRQNITPAGVQSVFDGRVYGVAFGPNPAEIWAVEAKRLVAFDWKGNRVISSIPLDAKPGLQAVAVDPAGRAFVTVANATDVRLLSVEGGAAKVMTKGLGTYTTGTIALAREKNQAGQRIAVIPIIAQNKVAVVDVESGRALGAVSTGIAPVGAAVNASGTLAYVSNWAGRVPATGDATAPAGRNAKADQVVIDNRGIASTGTLTKIDLTTLAATAHIAVELHPTALVWDEPRQRLYVANGNSDTVSVIDTATDKIARTIALRPFGAGAKGTAPTALALTSDGATLYVACGGINAVAVVRTADGVTQGLIPTAWYPNGLALSPDNQLLAVSTMLGVGSGWRDEFWKRFVHSYRGTVNVLPVPGAAQLASYTTAVAENNRLSGNARAEPAAVAAAANATPLAIPQRAGEPSLIEHVVYIVKENRTYDQVLGDLKKGNGDPSLVMFGEDVTPNQHRLADNFVLLDNFYASGGNSGDGHQWITQSNASDYAMWPGWDGRSYPYDGTDPVAYSAGGFLWDYALRAKKTVQVFGEFAPSTGARGTDRAKLLTRWRAGENFAGLWQTKSPIPPLDANLVRDFPGYGLEIPDVVRARIFLSELKKWETAGKMPNLIFLQLPSNHTRGTTPGVHTAKAMVADNDLALGQVVEGLSHSPFWKKMVIFVAEDDAQNGVDHVDGHRTVALAISPYVRRGHVDSTFYAHTSISKTIELVLGLPTISLFDLIANDMRASFREAPDFTPYSAVEPKQSLDEVSPETKKLAGEQRKAALASARMKFDTPDAAPTDKLNRILWHDVRGWNVAYPGVKRGAFAPLAIDVDDDDR